MDLFLATVKSQTKNTTLGGALIWRYVAGEIIKCGYNNNGYEDSGKSPTIISFPLLGMIKLILQLFDSVSPSADTSPAVAEEKLPVSLENNDASQQSLLTHLALQSAAEERLLASAIECSEQAIIVRLAEMLTLESRGRVSGSSQFARFALTRLPLSPSNIRSDGDVSPQSKRLPALVQTLKKSLKQKLKSKPASPLLAQAHKGATITASSESLEVEAADKVGDANTSTDDKEQQKGGAPTSSSLILISIGLHSTND